MYHPIVSAFLSLALPGLGQIYNGRIRRGLFGMAVVAVLMFLMRTRDGLWPWLIGFWLLCVLDSYRLGAKRRKRILANKALKASKRRVA